MKLVVMMMIMKLKFDVYISKYAYLFHIDCVYVEI